VVASVSRMSSHDVADEMELWVETCVQMAVELQVETNTVGCIMFA